MENLFKTMEYNVPSFFQHTSTHHRGYPLLKDPCQSFFKGRLSKLNNWAKIRLKVKSHVSECKLEKS